MHVYVCRSVDPMVMMVGVGVGVDSVLDSLLEVVDGVSDIMGDNVGSATVVVVMVAVGSDVCVYSWHLF